MPLRSGRGFSVDSPPRNAVVTVELAAELRRVLERFAREAGFTGERALGLYFRPGIFGHHRAGRAVDIYAVGRVGIEEWKRRWDEASRSAAAAKVPPARRSDLDREGKRNLGWQLYKALQRYGHWSRPPGYPVQLFGPWTRTEGPWRPISDFLLWAHRDHIHVAK